MLKISYLKNIAVLLMTIIVAGVSHISPAAQEDDISNIKSYLENRNPPINARSIAPTPIFRIYEIYAGGTLFYVDKTGSFALVGGALIDDIAKKNLTEDRLNQLGSIKFSELPLHNAIAVRKGNGAFKFAVFTDPRCPYCKALEQGLAKNEINNYTAYIFLYPLKQLHPDAIEKSESIWCSKDNAEAWTNFMVKGIEPVKKTCSNPVAQNIKLAEEIGVNGTPSIYLEDGHQAQNLNDLITKIKDH
jgi:thiol:disulfide interchange protein DsbC